MPSARLVFLAALLAVAVPGCELFLDINDTGDELDAGQPPIAPDSAAPDGPSRLCTVDSLYIDVGNPGSRYRVLGDTAFQPAQARCRVDGAELVSLNSVNESDGVLALIRGLPVHVDCDAEPCAWVGLTQGPGAVATDEGWRWPDGTTDQQIWAVDQPDDANGTEDGSESCAILDDLGLRDESCLAESFAICECEL